jgi:putative peptide zinc metalloprotease protein
MDTAEPRVSMTEGREAGERPDLEVSWLHGLEARLLVDTSEARPVHLLTGRNGAYLRLTRSAIHLLQEIARGASFEQLAERANRGGEERVSAAEVEASYRRLVEQIATIETKSTEPKGAFWLRRRVVSESVVAGIAALCSRAFHPVAAGLLILMIAAGVALALRAGLHAQPGHFWPGYFLFLVSLTAHEIGHASACARYGAKPGEIGFTLYMIYPAFYSDVSAAWTLKRWQRVAVDLGGVYFQLIAGSAYAVALALSGWEPLRVALLFIAGSCLFSLNPILKFDGYWVVADALGVTNLGQQPSRIVRHVVERLRGRPTQPLPWSTPVTVMLAIYSVMSFGFWAWFIGKVAPTFIPLLIRSAGVITSFGARFAAAPGWPDAGAVKDVLTSTYILFFVLLMFLRLVRAITTRLKNRMAVRARVVLVSERTTA